MQSLHPTRLEFDTIETLPHILSELVTAHLAKPLDRIAKGSSFHPNLAFLPHPGSQH